jgi:hypothetical protein
LGSHSSRSNPAFEMVEAVSAKAIFIGLQYRRTAPLQVGCVYP